MTFKMWSFGHLLFIISPFIFTVITVLLTKKLNFEKKRKLGIIFSIICIVILVLRNLEIFLKNGKTIDPELIPFQICHFANFVLFFAFLKNKQSLFSLALYFNLPFAFMSILFANSLANYATIITFRGFAYIFGHLLIVGITLWAFISGLIKVNKKSFFQGLIVVIILFISSLFINNLFNILMNTSTTNYFYTLSPEGGTPLELLFNLGKEYSIGKFRINPIYILGSAIFGVILYTSFYILAKLAKKTWKF